MVRRLYNWILSQADKPYAELVLFCMAVAEASFFPIFPDILLLPMVVGARNKAWRFAAICTLGSVIGAFIGYGIGALFMKTIGQWVIDTYHLQNTFLEFQNMFNKYGVWIILAKGVTPIPFKLITIASGAAGLNLLSFGLACAVTRGARFFLIAALVKKFGEPISKFIEKYLPWVLVGILVAIAAGFWLVFKE